LSVEAYDRANTRLLATGQLATLDNQIDTTTGTVKLRATFANPDEAFVPEPVRQCPAAGEHHDRHNSGCRCPRSNAASRALMSI